MLKHKADLAIAHAAIGRLFAVEMHRAGVRQLQPRDDPQQRGFARARQSQQRDQFAGRDVEADVIERDEIAEGLADVADFDTHAAILLDSRGFAFDAFGGGCGQSIAQAAAHNRLSDQRHQRQQRQQRRDRERGREIIIVVQDFDIKRHRIGQPADMSRDHRDRAEFAHRARVADDHAVQQSPFDVRQRDAQEGLPAARAQRHRRLLLVGTLAPPSPESTRARRTEKSRRSSPARSREPRK